MESDPAEPIEAHMVKKAAEDWAFKRRKTIKVKRWRYKEGKIIIRITLISNTRVRDYE